MFPHSGRWEWPTQLLRNLSTRFYGSTALERRHLPRALPYAYESHCCRCKGILIVIITTCICLIKSPSGDGLGDLIGIARLRGRGTVCSLPWLTCSVQMPFSARLGGGGCSKKTGGRPAACRLTCWGQIFGSRTAGGAFEKLI